MHKVLPQIPWTEWSPDRWMYMLRTIRSTIILPDASTALGVIPHTPSKHVFFLFLISPQKVALVALISVLATSVYSVLKEHFETVRKPSIVLFLSHYTMLSLYNPGTEVYNIQTHGSTRPCQKTREKYIAQCLLKLYEIKKKTDIINKTHLVL